MASRKAVNTAVPPVTRGTLTAASQTRTRARSPDSSHSQVDVVKNCEQARIWLESKNLLVPLEAKATLPMLSTTLFHISELSKVPTEVAQAIRSVAWLLGELEEETVAQSTRSAVNDQLDYMNTET